MVFPQTIQDKRRVCRHLHTRDLKKTISCSLGPSRWLLLAIGCGTSRFCSSHGHGATALVCYPLGGRSQRVPASCAKLLPDRCLLADRSGGLASLVAYGPLGSSSRACQILLSYEAAFTYQFRCPVCCSVAWHVLTKIGFGRWPLPGSRAAGDQASHFGRPRQRLRARGTATLHTAVLRPDRPTLLR